MKNGADSDALTSYVIHQFWRAWNSACAVRVPPHFAFLVAACWVCPAWSDVYEEIRHEATKINIDSEGYALPLVSHWTTGKDEFSKGWAPERQFELLDRGHYLLPWFEMPGRTSDGFPRTAAEFATYYEKSIKKAAAMRLPLVFSTGQWEAGLSMSPYLERPPESNPNVITATGSILPKVSPFGAVEPWREIGVSTTATPWLRQIAEWYPEPPLIIFLSNNEHAKLKWKDAELDFRYASVNAGATDAKKRADVAAGWIERYRTLQSGMREGLPNPAWRSVSIFVGYEASGPRSFGRWPGWGEYALHTEDYIDPSPYMWDGGSPSFYTDNWNTITDFKVFSPQVEFMNLVFMNESARSANPRFWYEMSIWDGHMPDDPASDKRNYYVTLGQTYGPERYEGFVKFGMWLTRPRVLREFRGWLYPREQGNDYFMSLVRAVDEVHQTGVLREWWRNGELIPNPKGNHPYQSNIPPEYQNEDRWFLLDVNVNPPRPWALATELKVFALALVRNGSSGNEWLLFAHSPLGPLTDVIVTVPGFGPARIDVSPAGAYYQISGGQVLKVAGSLADSAPSPPSVVRVD